VIDTEFSVVSDKAPIEKPDMPAYWRLMEWAHRLPVNELRRHAQTKVFFTDFWEAPEDWRGKLVELKLNVRRVLSYEAPENELGIETIYEAWGWSDESRTYPYVVVFTELPEGMEIGSDVREDITFVGYFLKILAYEASDKKRGAPMMVGQVIRTTKPSPSAKPSAEARKESELWFMLICGGALVLMMLYTGSRIFRRKKPASMASGDIQPGDISATNEWLIDLPVQPANPPEASSAHPPETTPDDMAPKDTGTQGDSGPSS
jgi:hypothetical protein